MSFMCGSISGLPVADSGWLDWVVLPNWSKKRARSKRPRQAAKLPTSELHENVPWVVGLRWQPGHNLGTLTRSGKEREQLTVTVGVTARKLSRNHAIQTTDGHRFTRMGRSADLRIGRGDRFTRIPRIFTNLIGCSSLSGRGDLGVRAVIISHAEGAEDAKVLESRFVESAFR